MAINFRKGFEIFIGNKRSMDIHAIWTIRNALGFNPEN
jgi:hypothetical protein